jgi:hypothetical protein
LPPSAMLLWQGIQLTWLLLISLSPAEFVT